MEQVKKNNVTKGSKLKNTYSSVRVLYSTQNKLSSLLSEVNKKDFGKRVKANELIELALGLIKDDHIKELQNKSLSNSDLLDMKFDEHVKKFGPISKDEYIGILLKGQLKEI